MGGGKEVIKAPLTIAEELRDKETWYAGQLPLTDKEIADRIARREGLTFRERRSLHHSLRKMSRKSKRRMFGF